jgi:hypothetical protein
MEIRHEKTGQFTKAVLFEYGKGAGICILHNGAINPPSSNRLYQANNNIKTKIRKSPPVCTSGLL